MLDGAEVIIRMYEIDKAEQITLIHSQTRDLALFTPNIMLKPSEVIAVITETLVAGTALQIQKWGIVARNVPEDSIHEIALATNCTIENLLLSREQEMLCHGLSQYYFPPLFSRNEK